MRILPDPEQPFHFHSAPAPAVASAPAIVSAPADLDRMAALERSVQIMAGKVEELKSQVRALHETQKAAKAERPIALTVAPAVVPMSASAAEPKTVPVPKTDLEVDAEALKKNLLSKMWKYLHDEPSSKAV